MNVVMSFQDGIELDTLKIVLMTALRFATPLEDGKYPWLFQDDTSLQRTKWLKAPMGNSIVYNAKEKKRKTAEPKVKAKRPRTSGAKPAVAKPSFKPEILDPQVEILQDSLDDQKTVTRENMWLDDLVAAVCTPLTQIREERVLVVIFLFFLPI